MTPTGMRMVMLIDDEPAQQRLVSALAARAGWRTVFAGDSETAIATLGTRDGMMLDAVLLDHSMHSEEAVALIREIKARRQALPILMLTAVSDVGMAVEAMRAGATDFLVKPIAPDRLLAALDAAVDDQSRVATPGRAIRNGSSYLVIGRPITKAADPVKALADIDAEVRGALAG